MLNSGYEKGQHSMAQHLWIYHLRLGVFLMFVLGVVVVLTAMVLDFPGNMCPSGLLPLLSRPQPAVTGVSTREGNLTSPKQPNVIVDSFFEADAVVPGLPYPFIDSTSSRRCDIFAAMQRPDPEITNLTISNATITALDGVAVATIVAFNNKTGGLRTYGGDVIICRLVGGGKEGQFRTYAFSRDHCNGTYTCSFDMRYARPGKYYLQVSHHTRGYLHEIKTVSEPTCGATIGGVYINNTAILSARVNHWTTKVNFTDTTLRIKKLQPLRTLHLPQCTMNSPAQGRWVYTANCFDTAAAEAIASGKLNPFDQASGPVNSTCRRGHPWHGVRDMYTWVPYHCSLRYISIDDFTTMALARGERTFWVLGDSRSYNLALLLSDFFRGARPDPKTGIVPDEDLAISVPLEEKEYWNGSYVRHELLVDNDEGLKLMLSMTYGSHNGTRTLPCNPDTGSDIVRLREHMGSLLDRLNSLLAAAEKTPVDVLIMQDGGLHDMWPGFSDEDYLHNVDTMIAMLKQKFRGRVIYYVMPSTDGFGMGFVSPFTSSPKLWRRSRLGAARFRAAGYEVWDPHMMTATRGDRYYDYLHFYVHPLKRPNTQAAFPITLGMEMVQDLANRMYPWKG
eukprot:comp24284_c0_seq2/m.45380 comp24284_c0_seq2/g.45380  ORF comp24284_c0_seq2/g.45380 comp24284_c0_seq2/m.45380 type:complete len:620 (-) comp24284_c0_seq2:5-1864(-)